MITNQPGIELIDVRLDHPRGGPPLVRDANLRVTGGERALIVGAAGVGTSRLVAAVLGEVTPGAGRIEVLGRDVGKLRRSSLRLLRRRVGIVPQDLCLLEDRSAQLNIVLPLEIDGIPRSISIVNAARVVIARARSGHLGIAGDVMRCAALGRASRRFFAPADRRA
ncbi:MAG: ATP-binding cassette domain-containing protein [Deltaproteobacteria bacterium]|nr:MAG: ATP-binding cassette domain-containing protein [Deltaproteobacteria bacterium]